jgi:ketosteroid isomerase-like protein
MKKFFVLLFITSIHYALAQSPEESIRAVMKTQSDAWNQGDIDGFMKYYWNNPDLTFVSKRGVSKGWQQVYDNYKKGYPDKTAMGKLTFDKLEFDKMSGTTYMVTGSWFLEYEQVKDANNRDNVGGWFTLIFKKFKKDWLIVYDHTS